MSFRQFVSKKRDANELDYKSKNNKDQYLNNIILFCYVTICKQKNVSLEDITKKEEISSSKSDPKPELNEKKNPHPILVLKKLKSK